MDSPIPTSNDAGAEKGDGGGPRDDDDDTGAGPYAYLDRDGNTCENFKIEIKNLPRYSSYGTVKKMLMNHIKVKPQKIKLAGNHVKFAFVAFTSDQERKTAIDKLNGYQWKGKILAALPAAPKADPFVTSNTNNNKKRTRTEEDNDEDGSSSKEDEMPKAKKGLLTEESPTQEELQEKLNDQVCSFWKMSYPEELDHKTRMVKEFMTELLKDILRMLDNAMREPGIPGAQSSKEFLQKWFVRAKRERDKKPCHVDAIIPSPVTRGYRNKCEFSVGSDGVVGFRLGAYKDGQLKVATVEAVPFVSDEMKNVVLACQHFFQNISSLKPFDNLSHKGCWKQVMVRSNLEKKHLVMITIDVKEVTDDVLAEEVEKLKTALSLPTVSSLHLELVSKHDRKQKDDRFRHLSGDKALTEQMTIHGKQLKFSISPVAFFQINTKAAEVCYEMLGTLLDMSEKFLLLDICCGTGTIGLSLAHRVKQVVGIELSKEAVDDARLNATLNGISNVEFVCGRAEEQIHRVLNSHSGDKSSIIAIIDPPRAGLNHSLIKALRAEEKVTKVLYVSCDAKFAKQNLVDLCRPISKVYRGHPFLPTKVVPIDMFPTTNRCELLFLYERTSFDSTINE